MDYLISQKIQEFEKASNPTEKVIKVCQSLEFIIMYYASVFYCHTKAINLVSKDIIEIVQTNFYKKNPLISSWIKLLRASLDLCKIDQLNFDNNIGIEAQNAAKQFLPDSSKKEINKQPSLNLILESIAIIRNKAFAHSASISSESIKILLDNSYHLLPYKLDEYLSQKNQATILLAENICHITNDEQTHSSTFLNLSDSICKNKQFEMQEGLDFENVYSKNLYCFFPKNNNFISLSPFLVFRDNQYLYYSGIDNKAYPVYNDIFSTKYISMRIYENAFKQLVEEDISLLDSAEIAVKLTAENNVFHNLPTPLYNRFIGRAEAIDKIIKALKNRRIFLISVSGIGGVGKSAVTIKTAEDLIELGNALFSYIIWVSAKRTYLTPEGIKAELQVFSNLVQLLDVILKMTGFLEYLKYTSPVKKQIVLEILSLDNFLIIVDNFETLANPSEFLDFFEEIGDQCPETKIIITSRHQLGSSEKIIDLREFQYNEYKDFIDYLFNEKFQIEGKIRSDEIRLLFEITGGLPLATEFFVGQISKQNTLQKILNHIKESEIGRDSILEFSFNESFKLLSDEAKKVLFSISLLDKPNLNNICFLTGLDEFDVEETIEKLKNLSFINVNYEESDTVYSILPLTKMFLEKNLDSNPALSSELNAKQKEYEFITSVSKQMAEDEIEHKFTITSDNIAVRLARAAYFLASKGDFTKSEQYFNQALSYESSNSLVWYHWAIAERDFSNNVKDDYFEKAIKYSTDNEKEDILFEWGKTLASFNRHKESIDVLEKLVKRNSENKNAFHMIGKSYYQIGINLWRKHNCFEMKKNYQSSLDAFKRSLYNSPNTHFEKNHNVVGYYFMAKISRFLGNINDAVTFAHNGLKLQPNNYRLLEFAEDLAYLSKRQACHSK